MNIILSSIDSPRKYLIYSLFFFFSLSISAKEISGIATVIDGDTIEIHGTSIRLFGIDAFENNQTCLIKNQTIRCGAKSAWFLDALIAKSTVRCIKNGKDRYGRMLAECHRANVSLNKAMVLSGWALAFSRYSDKYKIDEDTARSNKAGAWAGSFTAPWDFRANRNTIFFDSNKSLQSPQGISSASKSYKSCKEAHLDNVYRIKKGDPRYRPSLDRDKNGIACE